MKKSPQAPLFRGCRRVAHVSSYFARPIRPPYEPRDSRGSILKAIADLPGLQSTATCWDDQSPRLPHISRLALADPETSFTQQDVLGLLGLSDDEFAQRIFSRCGVQRRSLTLTDEFLATTVQGRTPAIEEHLLGYAVRAIDELEIDPAGDRRGRERDALLARRPHDRPPARGPLRDGPVHRQVPRRGRRLCERCAAYAARLADPAPAGFPGKKALVVAAESMTGILMGAAEDDERSKTVGSSIFGDGCAAA